MSINVLLVSIIGLVPLLLTCASPRNIPDGYYHGAGVVTKWPTVSESPPKDKASPGTDENHHEPGWMRKQLLRFGEVASKIGNAMGSHATKISAALDKICEVFKTVIPLLAAVCHVGQFGFCSATDEVPAKLSAAINVDSLNLDSLDR